MVALSQIAPQTCSECPLARPLYADRFSCGSSLSKVVRGHHPSTAECHDAVCHLSHRCLVAHNLEGTSRSMRRYFQPLPLPDLQGLEPEWVCEHIRLALNWLDVFDDAPGAKDGEIAIEVCHQHLRIGYLRRDADLYYCNRLGSLRSPNPYWLALHLIHPDYLYLVVDEIVEERLSVPDYF